MGCVHGTLVVQVQEAEQSVASSRQEAPRILIAQKSTDTNGERRLLVVFSDSIDPMSLHVDHFIVVGADGESVGPKRVSLAPVNERDECRSVILEGAFAEQASQGAVLHVVGSLVSQEGVVLEGLSAPLVDAVTSDSLVWAEWGEGGCTPTSWVVKTFWSDALQGGSSEDLKHIRLFLPDGSELQATGFPDFRDPQELEPLKDGAHGSEKETIKVPSALLAPAYDHVIDFCFEQGKLLPGRNTGRNTELLPGRITATLVVDAALFWDNEGHLSRAFRGEVHEQKKAGGR